MFCNSLYRMLGMRNSNGFTASILQLIVIVLLKIKLKPVLSWVRFSWTIWGFSFHYFIFYLSLLHYRKHIFFIGVHWTEACIVVPIYRVFFLLAISWGLRAKRWSKLFCVGSLNKLHPLRVHILNISIRSKLEI